MQTLRMYFKEDQLVTAPTRAPKPLSKVAENISIVTAAEIESMNAHTVLEVLERVTGVFVNFGLGGHDFGGGGFIYIQGSEHRHILVLLDGMPWNALAGGIVTQPIPVKIIKRMEIIKGPASSAWGSSLGGVINIVTKDAGDSVVPSGSVSGSIGERDTHDYSAEAAGKAGIAGYYIYAGRQDSDGLRDNRSFENDNIYGKLDIPFSSDIKLLLTAGYGDPHADTGDLPSSDLATGTIERAFFTTATLSAGITDNLSFEASYYTFKQKGISNSDILSTGEMFVHEIYDEESAGGSAKLIYRNEAHTAVAGYDVSHGKLDHTIDSGDLVQSFGAPAHSVTHPGMSKWAVFFNDTISIGNFSITPGIRYDKNNVSGDFTSPSIGATYKIGSHTIIRASVAKGFSTPLLASMSGGGLFLDPNPDLKPEKIWSYQAGVETRAMDVLTSRLTYFHHEMKEAIDFIPFAGGPPAFNDKFFNLGEIKRDGVELDMETVSFYNITVKAGVGYVHKTLDFETDTTGDDSIYNYAYNLALLYDDRKSFSARLDGHYIWWDTESSSMARYDDFIWDLNLRKGIYSKEKINADVFLTAHNLFNGSQYDFGDRKNPRRWTEAGVRIKF
ncbi:MAG: TonB-dependent receptor [Nitrospirae bacterium]|nr:TonB-dependent receptor [Nitrospirota bacterium]